MISKGLFLNNNLVSKAAPFAEILNYVENNQEFQTEDEDVGFCELVPIALNKKFSNLFAYLRDGIANYVFVDGICEEEDETRAKGLLCINGNRQLADADNCFFIGNVSSDECQETRVLLTARQLDDFLGIHAKFMVCSVCILEPYLKIGKQTKSFEQALYGVFEEREDDIF